MVIALIGLTLMGFNTVRFAGVPISDIVFFGLAGLLWLMMLTGRVSRLSSPTYRRSSPRLLVATVVLLSLATVSSFQSWYPAESVLVVVRIGYLTVLWFWMLRCISVDRRAIARLMVGWRWGVLIAAVAAIVANAGLVAIGTENPENRQTAWFYHPNDLAGFIAVAVPLFILSTPRSVTQRSRRANLSWMLTLGVVVFALSTTGSMSGLLAAAAGLGVSGAAVMATRRRRGSNVHPLKAMAVLSVALVGLVVLFSSDVPVAERLTRYGEGDSQIAHSVDSRGDLNQRAISSFDQVLVVGHGLDNQAQDVLRGGDGGIHNMYVKLLYEGGLLALLGLLAMVAVMLQQGWRLLISMRTTDAHLDLAAVYGSAAAGLVFAFFQPTTVQRYFWMPFAIIQCFWTLRRTELASRDDEPAADTTGGSVISRN